jgi:single-stranded-DNA-specific exonuclease
MKYRWAFAPAQSLLASGLALEVKRSPLLIQCLLNRGLTDPALISNFLEPRLKQLADPFLLPDMSKAVDRLIRARDQQQNIVIFGDYDVDGVTSTALLTEVLRKLGWKVQYYLPHRLDEGYGLSQEALENCLSKFPSHLVLAVDCGSTAVQPIAWLKARGVDTIVLDHHQVSTPTPAAEALVNPQMAANGSTSFRELCSVGLAFKLAHALVKRARALGWPIAADFDLRPYLDLVALGTIADLVPLTGENRILVTAGLERLNRNERPGLAALRNVAQIEGNIGVYEVGFQLAPRLNAAGRLENAMQALDLLLASDKAQAGPLAMALDAQNRERQRIERSIVDQVIGAVRSRFNPETDYVIVEGQLLWHIGVVGIVASRVLKEFYRPTIIMGGDGIEWRGSGRSIEGFDLASALRACEDLLLKHGGHAMAAGLAVRSDRVDDLRSRLNDLAKKTLSADLLRPALRLDAEVDLSDVTVELLKEFEQLEPIGQANPAIQFAARSVRVQRQPQYIGKEKQHLKLWVTNDRVTHEAVWWNASQQVIPQGRFDLAFVPELNSFNGRESVQLKVLDLQNAR